ncbi:hypothetical protein GQ53DRAFT_841630 [Thozetella sp. PMI_491]|nr:hypothetical protein GQ53DRAFT_841630 [Thozetella sp. PMI_491]
MADTFPRFSELAYELRMLIWSFSCPKPTREVCIAQSQNIPKLVNGKLQAEPLIVQPAFPALAHVCHESRQLAIEGKLGETRLVPNAEAACLVPTRPFDPSLDTLYWPARQYLSFADFLGGYNGDTPLLGSSTAKKLKHLSIEWASMHSYPRRLVEYILESCWSLETLSVVFPHVPGKHNWTDAFPAPTRRSRLRLIGDDEAKSIKLTLQDPGEQDWYASLIPNPRGPYIELAYEFMESLRSSFDGQGVSVMKTLARSRGAGWYRGTTWSVEEDRFTGLTIVPEMFVEYRPGRWFPDSDGGGFPDEQADADVADKKPGIAGQIFSNAGLAASNKTSGVIGRLYSSIRGKDRA